MLNEQGVVSMWAVLGLVGFKVKFQASAFWFQPVQGLCSCGQQFSSGGGLLPISAIQECVSGVYLYLSENWEFSDSAMWQNYSLNYYQFPRPTAILCFHIFTFTNP